MSVKDDFISYQKLLAFKADLTLYEGWSLMVMKNLFSEIERLQAIIEGEEE